MRLPVLAAGNRIGKGSITSMSCDITANGYQPQADYILDQSGDQVTEMAVDATRRGGRQAECHRTVSTLGPLAMKPLTRPSPLACPHQAFLTVTHISYRHNAAMPKLKSLARA